MKTFKIIPETTLPLSNARLDSLCRSRDIFFMETTEIWKDIPGYEGYYQASNLGRIKSFYKNGKILNPSINMHGYKQIVLINHNGRKTWTIHRIIAKTFIPNIYNKPFINHINGIKTDNNINNIEWCTASENIIHGFKIGLIKRNKNEKSKSSKLSWDIVSQIRLIKNRDKISNRKLAKQYGVCHTLINKIINNTKWIVK